MNPLSRYTETIQRVLAGDFGQASEAERRAAVKDLIQVCSVAAAAVAIQPVPLADIVLLAPIQIALVQGVGRVHGHSLDRQSVLEMLGTFGASIVSQNVIMAAAKLVPFAGWLVGASMGYALTFAIGTVADHYFTHGRGTPESELRALFKDVFEQKKREREQAYAGSGTLKERLQQLAEARQAGLLSDDEYERKKQELLAAF